MATRTDFDIDEKTYGSVTATLTSDGSTAIPLSSVDSITMTLIEEQTGDVINSREAQDVLNTNNCTLDSTSGLFTWAVQTADTAIVGNTRVGDREHHIATFSIVWSTTNQMNFEIALHVLNLRKVPQS